MNVIRLDQPAAENPDSRPHLFGFDALRGGAALAVVLLHSCIAYLRHPMPGLVWPVRDSPSGFADVTFWAIEVVVMPVFLAMSGYFVWKSARRQTPGRLLKSRTRRLLVPLAFGVLFVLPADLYIWTLGLVADGVVPAVKLKSFKFDAPISEQIWGLSHLWFLQYVFLYVAVVALALSRGWLSAESKPLPNSIKNWIAPAGMFTAALVALWSAPEVVWGFQHSALPFVSKWVYCGAFFALGWWLGQVEGTLSAAIRYRARAAALGCVVLGSAVTMGYWYLNQSDPSAVAVLPKLCLVTLTIGAAVLVTLALLGAAATEPTVDSSAGHFAQRWRTPVSYLAEASFWIYVMHHPLLGLIHIDLKWLAPEMSPLVKLACAFIGCNAILLVSYQVCIRHTAFGRWIGLSGVPASKAETVIEASSAASVISIPAPPRETERRAA